MPGCGVRLQIDLSQDWAFVRKRTGREWLKQDFREYERTVDLPHCWNAKEAFRRNVSFYRGYGCYRKQFSMSPHMSGSDDATWRLESEGFYGKGDVWLNGYKVADVDGQYLGFGIDVGRYLFSASENILGVRLTNRCPDYVLPGIKMSEFFLYGGLTGKVWLRRVPRLHLDPLQIRITTRFTGGRVDAAVHFAIVNDSGRDRRGRAVWTLLDRTGRRLGSVETQPVMVARRSVSPEQTLSLRVRDPDLWAPDHPYLYLARGELFEEDRLQDALGTRFGVREACFRPDQGFFLNGERVPLRGCNRHESMPGFGSALPARIHREDAQQIKGLGLNLVRLSHYPQHPAFLEACDELGLLVYAEIKTWKSLRTGRWLNSACRQMKGMVRRDRNHPCIILWGMGNECRSRKACLSLRDVVRAQDPDRPVIWAENHFWGARRQKTVGVPDVWGCNCESGALSDACRSSRPRSVVVSECSNNPHAVRGEPAAELEQAASMVSDIERVEALPYVAGFALGSFNDYATLRRKRDRQHSGIVDAWRIPKISAACLQARYLAVPFVKVFGDWSAANGRGAERREVHVFSNCDQVELSCNGRSLHTWHGGGHLVREVDFEPGDLVAVGTKGDQRTVDRLSSWGRAHRLAVRPERSRAEALAGETVGFGVLLLDEQGHLVADWNGEVDVKVTGAAFLRSHREDRRVVIAAGVGRAFVTATGQDGIVMVRVEAGQIKPGTARIHFA